MSVTAVMIAQLRRMVAEPTRRYYQDDQLSEYISAYPLTDSDGNLPSSDDWVATYDLNAAAANVWLEKAGIVSEQVDHQQLDSAGRVLWSADSKRAQNAMRMYRLYSSQRRGRSTAVALSDEESSE